MWQALTTKATKRIHSSSAFTALRSKRKRSSRITSRCSKKRDHRKLGKELEIFVFDGDVGPGLPMFLPRGAVIADELEKLAKETEFAAGYQRVRTPHIAREKLYTKSGHLPYYADSMFPPMVLRPEEEQEQALANLESKIVQAEDKLRELQSVTGISNSYVTLGKQP